MNYPEMIAKTQLRITGIVKSVNEYISKKNGTVYYSVDLEIQGTKNPLNVRLESDFKRETLKMYDLVTLNCVVVPAFDGKHIEIQAITN